MRIVYGGSDGGGGGGGSDNDWWGSHRVKQDEINDSARLRTSPSLYLPRPLDASSGAH